MEDYLKENTLNKNKSVYEDSKRIKNTSFFILEQNQK